MDQVILLMSFRPIEMPGVSIYLKAKYAIR